jgi:hypothetical protein
MRCVGIFEEGTEKVSARQAHESAHLAFLKQHRTAIPMAGGLRKHRLLAWGKVQTGRAHVCT